MRQLLALIAVVYAGSAIASQAPCSSLADLTGIPVMELPATAAKPVDHFAVMVTGDGGWRKVDARVTDRLRAEGIPVVGFLASDYFRTRRTADESACALERVIRFYQLRWRKQNVVLVGYSRGADVLPFMITRLPDATRSSVHLIALLGLEPWIDFKYNPPWTLAHYFDHEAQFPVLPETEKLRGMNLLCVYGEQESDSLCPKLNPAAFKVAREPGGHHFAGRYGEVGDAIFSALQQRSR